MAKTKTSDPTAPTNERLAAEAAILYPRPPEVVDAIARLRATSPVHDEQTASALATVLDYLSPQDAA